MPDIVLPGATPSATLGNEDMPGNLDLKIYQGDYKQWVFTFQDANGATIDISNETPKAQFKSSYVDTNPVTLQTSIVNNSVVMTLTSDTSSSLIQDGYIYDLQLTDTAGRVKTYLTGDVTVVPQVTT